MRNLLFLLVTLTALAQPAAPPGTPPLTGVYDGFEAPTLSDLWEIGRFVPGAVSLQSAVVRAGHGAVRIDLHAHDRFALGKDGDTYTERDEIKEAGRLNSREDTPYEYSWSMYLFSPQQIKQLGHAYRLLQGSKLNATDALPPSAPTSVKPIQTPKRAGIAPGLSVQDNRLAIRRRNRCPRLP